MSVTTDRAGLSRAGGGVSRRLFFKGVGMCMGLPLLESMLPSQLRAATALPQPGTTASGAPLRMAFMYFPNGARQDYWWPAATGEGFDLARTMEPLAPLKKSIQVVGGL